MAEYIERAKALMLIDEVHGARSAYHRVKNIPAADVAPVVHGRWIERIGRAECSACHDECWALSALSYNYCPNCGARMDGE